MANLNEMDRGQALAVVVGSQTLREKFSSYVWESENDYIQDKLSCFDRGAISYCYGVCSHCYAEMRDAWGALRGVEESIESFGASTKVEKLARQARRLANSNLFDYMAQKLLGAWYESEIIEVVRYVENLDYAIYLEDAAAVENLAGDHFDCFLENGGLDGYFEEGGRLYQTMAIA